MSAVQQAIFSQDETLRMLTEASKARGDRFLVKISRRRGTTGLVEHISTLGDATLNQLASPETWLPVLVGGGEYAFFVSHADEPAARIGGMLTFKFAGEPLPQVNGAAVSSAQWQGPAMLIFPANGDQRFGAAASFQQPMPQPLPYIPQQPQVQQGYGPPPAPQGFGYAPGYDPAAADRERLRLQAETDLRNREFELKEKEREARIKADFERQQRDMEEKIKANANNSAGMKDILAALAPVVGMLIQSQATARAEAARIAAEAAERAEARALKQQELQMAQQQAAQQQFQVLLLKLTEKPGVDPTVTMMLEMMKANASGNAETMTRIVDAMGTVSKTSIGMIEAIADINLGGQPDHPLLQAVREGVKAMATLSGGAQAGAKQQVKAQQQLPAAAAAARPQPPPAQRLPPQAAPPSGLDRGERPAAPQPAPVKPSLELVTEPQTAFAGLETSTPPPASVVTVPEPEQGQVIAVLKQLITSKHEPVIEVAQFFIKAVPLDEMQDALDAHDGDVNKLIEAELGLWAISDPSNIDYLRRLGEAVDKLGAEAGLLETDEDGNPEETEDN